MRNFQRVSQRFNTLCVEPTPIEKRPYLRLYVQLCHNSLELFLDRQWWSVGIETDIEIDRAQFRNSIHFVRYAATDRANYRLRNHRTAAVGSGVALFVFVSPFFNRFDELGHPYDGVRALVRRQRARDIWRVTRWSGVDRDLNKQLSSLYPRWFEIGGFGNQRVMTNRSVRYREPGSDIVAEIVMSLKLVD